MTQPVGPYSDNGYPSSYNSKYGANGNSSGIQSNQYTNQPPLVGPMQGAGYGSPYAGNKYGNAPYDLQSALNLDPLSYQVYSGYNTQPYIYPNTQGGPAMQQPDPNGQYMPQGNGAAGAGQPPPPSYVDDSPAGFAANVIDPMLGNASLTYNQTIAMIDEYEKNKKK
jgi:hypothetical protein